MSDVRTFRAATMREALDLVREELGADAVILHTRQLERRRLLPWRKPLEVVEITASAHLVSTASDQKRPRRIAADGNGQPPRAAARGKASAPSSIKRLDLVSESIESLDELLRRSPADRRTVSDRERTGRRTSQPAAPRSRNGFDRRETAEPAAPASSSRMNRFTGRPIGDPTPQAPQNDPTAALAKRLDTIHQMLSDLGRGPAGVRDEVPAELFQVYTELIDADLEADLARELVINLKRSAHPRALADAAAAKNLLTAIIESEIHCCEPIATAPRRRKVVALVGATGVGKTTTIAKLAANFRLRTNVKLGLVTVDTYRVAAVEQLRTYAEIIDLPMKVVTEPAEMGRALAELQGLDLVLVDTAGRSPKDDLQIQELQSLLADAQVDEVGLVLSMTASPKNLEATAAKFAPAGITSLILTKLDEAAGMGSLLSVARRIKLPIRYLSAGQAVPDDIEAAHPRRIARLILGQERLSR